MNNSLKIKVMLENVTKSEKYMQTELVFLFLLIRLSLSAHQLSISNNILLFLFIYILEIWLKYVDEAVMHGKMPSLERFYRNYFLDEMFGEKWKLNQCCGSIEIFRWY